MSGKVSVIVPVYNAEKTIEKCVESILNQTYNNLELLLVDDGSKDSSLKKCYEYAKRDKRVVVIESENFGVSHARNIGIDKASGEFVAFIDSDDYIETYTYSDIITKMEEENIDIFKFAYYRENKKKNVVSLTSKTDCKIEKKEYPSLVYKNLYLTKDFESTCNAVFRKKVIENVRFNEQISVTEDFLFMVESLLNSNSIYFTNKPYYHYIVNWNSVSNKYNADTTLKKCSDEVVSYFTVKDMLIAINEFEKLKEESRLKLTKLMENKISMMACNEKFSKFKKVIDKLNAQENSKRFFEFYKVNSFSKSYSSYLKYKYSLKLKVMIKKIVFG